MPEEYLDIYNEQMDHIGSASRSEVHAKGYWHCTFQCWIVERKPEFHQHQILFQIRHANKETFPNKLDITAAGHLLAGEGVRDGVRELKEEMGISVEFDSLHYLGVFQERKRYKQIRDHEFCHVFLLENQTPVYDFDIELTEVAGILNIRLQDAIDLFQGIQDQIQAVGFRLGANQIYEPVSLHVTQEDFVPHQKDYYLNVFTQASRFLLDQKE